MKAGCAHRQVGAAAARKQRAHACTPLLSGMSVLTDECSLRFASTPSAAAGTTVQLTGVRDLAASKDIEENGAVSGSVCVST